MNTHESKNPNQPEIDFASLPDLTEADLENIEILTEQDCAEYDAAIRLMQEKETPEAKRSR